MGGVGNGGMPAYSLGVEVSQGFGAPSMAVLGPNGVVVLVVAEPCLSQGLGGAGRPAKSTKQSWATWTMTQIP